MHHSKTLRPTELKLNTKIRDPLRRHTTRQQSAHPFVKHTKLKIQSRKHLLVSHIDIYLEFEHKFDAG